MDIDIDWRRHPIGSEFKGLNPLYWIGSGIDNCDMATSLHSLVVNSISHQGHNIARRLVTSTERRLKQLIFEVTQ